jgi:hypothetical protein
MSYAENYKEIVWAPIPPAPPRPVEEKGKAPTVMPDIAEFVAPGKVLIGSRSKLRAYERATGTRQVGNDLKVEDYNAAKREPKIDQRRIEDAAYKALQRVMR